MCPVYTSLLVTSTYKQYINISAVFMQVVSRRCSLTGECSTSQASRRSSRSFPDVRTSTFCRPLLPAIRASPICVATDAVELSTRPTTCASASVDTAAEYAMSVSDVSATAVGRRAGISERRL